MKSCFRSDNSCFSFSTSALLDSLESACVFSEEDLISAVGFTWSFSEVFLASSFTSVSTAAVDFGPSSTVFGFVSSAFCFSSASLSSPTLFGVSTLGLTNSWLPSLTGLVGSVSLVTLSSVDSAFGFTNSRPPFSSAFAIAAATSSGSLSKGWGWWTVVSSVWILDEATSSACTAEIPNILAPIITDAAPIANLRML